MMDDDVFQIVGLILFVVLMLVAIVLLWFAVIAAFHADFSLAIRVALLASIIGIVAIWLWAKW